jgi:hypothetical protein
VSRLVQVELTVEQLSYMVALADAARRRREKRHQVEEERGTFHVEPGRGDANLAMARSYAAIAELLRRSAETAGVEVRPPRT